MAEAARKRNVFARHSWENPFYIERIGQLSGATILEVFLNSTLDDAWAKGPDMAGLLEHVALVSSIFGLQRKRMQALLAISNHRRFGFDLGISDGFKFLRSSSRREPEPRGIPVDQAFVRRFHRLGFGQLIETASSSHDLSHRLRLALRWLFESLQESSVNAAVVKTAIAFESLLVADERESLRGPLSDRSAYLLSDDPSNRRRIAKAVRKFYSLRSSIVHGGRKKPAVAQVAVLEGADRLAALVAITFAANSKWIKSFDDFIGWVEASRWGDKVPRMERPYPQSRLVRTLELLEGKS